MPQVGFRESSFCPNQVVVRGSFDTNDTNAPDGVRGRLEVTRTGAGVFKCELSADPNGPAAAYTQWDSYDVDLHGTNSSNYTVKVTASDAAITRPYITVTVYLKTYAVGAIDTYVATDTTDLKVCIQGVLLKAASF